MSPLLVVVSIVLVDLLGFTIVMPLLPRFAEEYGFSTPAIGLLMAAFPMCQLVAGPILGRLSDRFGRRPVLACSQAGTALSFLILGLSRNYSVMLLARMLDGASGGNILVAQAYIADVTKPEHRARSLGLIGAAFGVGFVLGPLLGGVLVSLPVAPEWRLRLPFLVAAGFSTLAWLLVYFYLPESIPADGRARSEARVLSWRGLAATLALPRVGGLVAIGALVVLGFAALEGTFSLFLLRRLHWRTDQAAYGFAALGLVSALIQGGLIRRLVPRFGEPRLIVAGIATLAAGLAAMAMVDSWPALAGAVALRLGLQNVPGWMVHSWPALAGAVLLIGIGHGLANPSVQGLLSRVTPAGDQGAVFGTLTSAQTLARMVNYLLANYLLGFGASVPYWEAAGVMVVALVLALGFVGKAPAGERSGLAEAVPGEAPLPAAGPSRSR